MAHLKWTALMLLLFVFCFWLLIVFFRTIGNHEVAIVSRGRFGDPLVSGFKKYLEEKGIDLNEGAEVELSSVDKKVKFIYSFARYYGKLQSFPQQSYVTTTPSFLLKKESTSDFEITRTNTIPSTDEISRQLFTVSNEITPSTEETTARARVKRELTADSKIFSILETTTLPNSRVFRRAPKHTARTTQFPSSTSQIDPKASATGTLPSIDTGYNTQNVRGIFTTNLKTLVRQEVTTTRHKEASTSGSNITKLEPSTDSNRFSREAPIKSRKCNKQKSVGRTIYRVTRALTSNTSQGIVIQDETIPNRFSIEATTKTEKIINKTTIPIVDGIIREAETTPMGANITEQSTLDQNLSAKIETIIPSRIERNLPMPTQTLPIEEVTRPRGRVFREIPTENPIKVEKGSIPTIFKMPFLRENKFMQGFIRNSFLAMIEGLNKVKLQAVKKISKRQSYPTFPPPTDPEGTDYY